MELAINEARKKFGRSCEYFLDTKTNLLEYVESEPNVRPSAVHILPPVPSSTSKPFNFAVLAGRIHSGESMHNRTGYSRKRLQKVKKLL